MEENQTMTILRLNDIELKNNILRTMFLNLSQESLLDICEILNGYRGRIHKAKKDTTLARCMFAYGYHNTKEFMDLLNLTKDRSEIEALSNNVHSIGVLNKLRHAFNIDDTTFVKIVREIEEIDTDLENKGE